MVVTVAVLEALAVAHVLTGPPLVLGLTASAFGCLVRAVSAARRAYAACGGRHWRRLGRRVRRWFVELREVLGALVLLLTGVGALSLVAPALASAAGLGPSLPLPLGAYVISSPFGPRRDPFDGTEKNHSGVDLAAPEGTPVYACRGGTVLTVSFSAMNGEYVAVRDADGVTWYYLHLSRQDVRPGDHIEQGAQLGAVGQTGRATGPHLHLQTYDQAMRIFDPSTLFPAGL